MSKVRIPSSVLVFLGAVFWSLNAPLVKFLTADPLLVCGLRSAIAGVALSPFLRWRRLNWGPWMLLYVCAYCGLCVSIILALSQTSATVAVGMQYTAVVWLFLARLLLTKKWDRRAFLPVAVVFAGVVLFMCAGGGGSTRSGNLIALTEGVFFACMTVGAQKSAGSNPLGLVAVANLFTALVLFAVFPGKLGLISGLGPVDWVILAVLGVVQVGGGYALYNLGVQRVSSQKAAIIALWEMILGPVWVALFLGEYPSLPVAAGFVVILFGIFLDARLNAPRPAKPAS